MERRRMRAVTAVSLALVLAAFSGPLVGCRGLLGIDGDAALRDGADDGGPQSEAAAGGDGGVDAPGHLPVEGGIDGGMMPVDRRYAQWALPPVSPLLSQYDLQEETVIDHVTGLEWQRQETDQDTMSYPAGVAYCNDLILGGQSDWRLPTRIELLGILDYGRALGGFLNETVFMNAASSGAPHIAWTTSLSLLRKNLVDHLVVDYYLSNVDINAIGQSSLIVRCVRGGPTTSPVNRYVIGSGTATDVLTKLTWQLVPTATTKDLEDATAICTDLSLGGFAKGWRLPTVRELASLIDEAREEVPLVSAVFTPGPSQYFWSSTTRANLSSDNWVLNDATGNLDSQIYANRLSVRCVTRTERFSLRSGPRLDGGDRVVERGVVTHAAPSNRSGSRSRTLGCS